jgi:hypothetical protein
MMLLCSPQELPLYKEELEIYFSPGRMRVATLELPSHLLIYSH